MLNKSNEITAIPELLKVLSLNGCIVTIDAIGCQTKIIKDIVAQDADYVMTLKQNQSSLYERVEDVFKQALINGYQGYTYSNYRLSAQEHDRSETRYYEILSNIQELVDPEGKWEKLNSVARVDYLRVKANGKSSLERRYYISSLPNDAELLAKAIRGHWNIENQLHWGGVSAGEASSAEPPLLDVQFSEDGSRIRKDNAPQNLAIIRQIALNLLNQDKTIKAGIKTKRKRAGWDNNYLLKVLLS